MAVGLAALDDLELLGELVAAAFRALTDRVLHAAQSPWGNEPMLVRGQLRFDILFEKGPQLADKAEMGSSELAQSLDAKMRACGRIEHEAKREDGLCHI